MSSCDVQFQCSICIESIDSTTKNRMIVESCGHRKCRKCFIAEESGCSICLHRNQLPINNNKRIEVIENVLLSPHIDLTDQNTKSERPLSNISVTSDENGQAILYTCKICDKSFKSRNNRKYHFYCDQQKLKPFACGKCDKKFITQSHLRYHEKTHAENRFMCKNCDRVFIREISLRKHQRKHSNEMNYKCSFCDQKFLYREQLNAHENRHKNKFHVCSNCGQKFLMKSNLTKHIRRHLGKNFEKCSICQKSYSGRSALKVHMLTHSKDRGIKCDSCEKTFVDRRTMLRHSRTHSEIVRYECTLCDVKTTRKDNIRRHVRNLHSNEDIDIETVLNNIMDCFKKKFENEENKSETHAVIVEVPSPEAQTIQCATTSVIKFAPRIHQQVDDVLIVDADSDRCNQHSETLIETFMPESQHHFEPLTLDPLPQIEQQMTMERVVSNINVYRQLLSPYLRRNTAKSDEANRKVGSEMHKASVIVTLPPKKNIEKYETT